MQRIQLLLPLMPAKKSKSLQATHYGLLAQETKSALKAVGANADTEMPIVTYDAKSDKFGLRYSELIAPIIKAIQQLYALWIANDQRVKTLELENRAMKNYLCVKDPLAPVCK